MTISEIYSEAFKITKEKFFCALIAAWFPIFFIFFIMIPQGVLGFVSQVEGLNESAIAPLFIISSLLIQLVAIVAQLTLQLGQPYYTLKLIDSSREGNEEPSITIFFKKLNKIHYLFVASILVGGMTFLGFLLLIIPGIYIMIRLILFPYYIVDQDCGPIEAIQRSYEDTKGKSGMIFVFMLCSMALAICGVLFFIIGIIVAVPIIVVAMGILYRDLSMAHAKKDPQVALPLESPVASV